MNNPVSSRSFFNDLGFAQSWKTAQAFAGVTGRVATMKDIVQARAANDTDKEVWNRYYTTTSAEYIGLSKTGVPLAVVTHGNGPLFTPEDWVKAYEQIEGFHPQDNGYIDIASFHDLVDGKFGDVTIIDLSAYAPDGNRKFREYRTMDEALDDPWTVARMGGDVSLAASYLQNTIDAGIIENPQGASDIVFIHDIGHGALMPCGDDWASVCIHKNLSNGDRKLAAARLLSISQLSNTHGVDKQGKVALLSEIDHHGRSNGSRFVGIRGSALSSIKEGGDISNIASNSPEKITVPHTGEDGRTFEQLLEQGGKLYIQTRKQGCVMDSGYPLHHLKSSSKIGDVVSVNLGEPASPFFFKYDNADVLRHAPEGANAYLTVSKHQNGGGQSIEVQFYQIEADYETRILGREEVYADIDLLMKLVA
ncbi:hypothetical protein [Mesorhizobium sp. SP-1A]|uniref:hypothetical protein n=1 Tax=Mesorhizobium sp. SP-1A TaxID=3077840 RepID=UPI0028F6FC91|nr:hypothetical protein [Mesorhizobium sp. SP-1A]